MRILWLSPWLRPIARISAENLLALGAEVMLVTADLHPESEGERPFETLLLGRPVPTKDWFNIFQVYLKAKHFKPDVVVTELLRDPRWRVFSGLAPRVRLIHDDKPHDRTHRDPWWIRSFETWDSQADATVVFSEYVARQLSERGAPGPIYRAPLVTDLDASIVPGIKPAEARQNFTILGRQRPYKNYEVVFPAWEAHTRGASWQGDQLVLIGDGDVPFPLPPQASWRRGNFRYADVVEVLARAKGSVVHCRDASQSGVQIVSMQLGVTPIASDVGALPEYQPPQAKPVGVNDVDGLRDMFDALADPAEAERQGRAAAAHYGATLQPQIAAQRLVQIFNHVVNRK